LVSGGHNGVIASATGSDSYLGCKTERQSLRPVRERREADVTTIRRVSN